MLSQFLFTNVTSALVICPILELPNCIVDPVAMTTVDRKSVFVWPCISRGLNPVMWKDYWRNHWYISRGCSNMEQKLLAHQARHSVKICLYYNTALQSFICIIFNTTYNHNKVRKLTRSFGLLENEDFCFVKFGIRRSNHNFKFITFTSFYCWVIDLMFLWFTKKNHCFYSFKQYLYRYIYIYFNTFQIIVKVLL